MSKLFIIGNGFDIAHGLPTKYEDFHEYLRDNYPNANEEFPCVPSSTLSHHGEEIWDRDEVVGYLMSILMRSAKDDWSDFEDALGDLDFSYDLFDPSEYPDREGDPDYFHAARDNEDVTTQLAGCVPQILDLFSEWVESIDLRTRPKDDFQRLIDPSQDMFLSFNYTRTLEEFYGVPDVCHIHGVLGEDLVVGHGAGRRFDEDQWSRYIGSENGIESIQDALRKDTDGAMKKHQDFFQKLSFGLSAIYSYGFSFGKADEAYLQEICRIVPTQSLTWHLLNYPLNTEERHKDHKRFKEVLRKCGFKGIFSTFDCE